MTGLDWFAARSLALEKRAIRRDGWKYWLLYRFCVWIISETDAGTGNESRRVVRAEDFRDSEFLAKDWCDEVWEGGSYPPCTIPGPAKDLPANSVGAWTLTQVCGGNGDGGGVPPPSFAPGGGGTEVTDADDPFTFRAVAIGTSGSNPDPLRPATGSCWPSAPAKYGAFFNWFFPINIVPPFNPDDHTTIGRLRIWFSDSGVDFTGVANSEIGTISGSEMFTVLLFPATDGSGATFIGGRVTDPSTTLHSIYKHVFDGGISFTAGDTITARGTVLGPSGDDTVYAVFNRSITFEPLCAMT